MTPITTLLFSICLAGVVGHAVETCRGVRCGSTRADGLRRPAVPYTIIHPSTAREPVRNPVKEPVRNPVKEPVRNPVKEPVRNPVKEAVRKPVTEPLREPILEPLMEPIISAPTMHECEGVECAQARRRPCSGRECLTERTLMHMRDGADRTPREFDSTPELQLTCDIRPGSIEVPSKDALVLQIDLAKGQEKLMEEHKAQQAEVKNLQNSLKDQQAILVAQQREILDQQMRLMEQLEQVKSQYSLIMNNIQTVALETQYKDREVRLDSQKPLMRTHTQEAYTMHKVDMEESVMDVGGPMPACTSCQVDEFCDLSGDWPRCEKCTVCLPGFFLVSQCSFHADRICQDQDECLEVQNLCGGQNKCLNTPGGFRCTGMSAKDAVAGMCGHKYFYNLEMQECQACSECDSQSVASSCSAVRDTICSSSESELSLSWSGEVSLVQSPSMKLYIQGDGDGSLVSCTEGSIVLNQHGLVWVDHNLALRHGCRSFIQACLSLNSTEDGGRDLSGVRIEQKEGRSLQSISISGVTTVDPGHMLSLFLKSSSNHCGADNEKVNLQPGLISSVSLLWISHDTGAVAMTAQTMASAHYHSNYRPTFRTSFMSDPYMVTLSHDNRCVRFTEKGTVKFVLQQAVYSMGHACVSEGFFLLAYVNRNGTSFELTRVFKPGVHYRDTSISLSAAVAVDAGDMLSFEMLAPAQCSVRYFGDDSGISMLSLLWIPTTVSSTVSAAVSKRGLPSGAVRNKPLFFRQTSQPVAQVELANAHTKNAHRNFIFRDGGTASVSLELRLIHSCSLIELTLLQEGSPPRALARQVGGQMPEGSEWANMGLRASFPVKNGTEVYATVDCVRGRLNQISHDAGSDIFILWTAA